MNNKKIYREHCIKEVKIPIFSQPWWLDTVAGEDNWDVAIVEKEGLVVASMPYVIYKRFGKTKLIQPPLTQTLGPWIREVDEKQTLRLRRQKDLFQKLIEALPHYDDFKQSWHFSHTNWLPFYWAGFTQTTRYTYRLTDLSNQDKLWSNFRANIRREIRKAKNRFCLNVYTDKNIEVFYRLYMKTFERQGKNIPNSKNLVVKLNEACENKNAKKIFIAQDTKGEPYAGIFLVWDKQSAYYLMGGSEPNFRTTGAFSLCLWEAIKFASTVTNSFDFEGSMKENIERYFQAFGAKQTMYFSLNHTPSKFIKTVNFVRDILKSKS